MVRLFVETFCQDNEIMMREIPKTLRGYHLKKYKLSTLLSIWRSSPAYMIMSAYPSKFKIWEFHNIPFHTYDPKYKDDKTAIRHKISKKAYLEFVKQNLRDLSQSFIIQIINMSEQSKIDIRTNLLSKN